jgi:hypothetical protein
MENTFELPARPWGEAEVAYLIRNADSLSEEVRAELGIVPVVADENFQADFDAAHVVVEEAPVVETEEVTEHVITEEDLENNPGLSEEVSVGDVIEFSETDVVEPVVNNTADNA